MPLPPNPTFWNRHRHTYQEARGKPNVCSKKVSIDYRKIVTCGQPRLSIRHINNYHCEYRDCTVVCMSIDSRFRHWDDDHEGWRP